VADKTAKPEARRIIPLGDSAGYLGELYNTFQGAKLAAQAAIGATNQAGQRWQDASAMFKKINGVADAADAHFDFAKGVMVVEDEPA